MTGLKDYKNQQKLIGVLLFSTLTISIAYAIFVSMSAKLALTTLTLVILLIGVSLHLRIEHMWRLMQQQIYKFKIRQAVKNGKALKTIEEIEE